MKIPGIDIAQLQRIQQEQQKTAEVLKGHYCDLIGTINSELLAIATLYDAIKVIAKKLDVELPKPRVCMDIEEE